MSYDGSKAEGTKSNKGVTEMAENGKEDIILMAMFMVTKADVLAGADELGIPEEQVTDEVIELVKQKVSQELGHWRGVIKDMVKEAIKKATIECPLGLACSPSCAWREVGECVSSRAVK